MFTDARDMTVFPRFATGEFTPLFRLLDDYATHTVGRNTGAPHRKPALRTFQPRFDLKEGKDAYELEGELPGIDQKNVNIEFTDPQTLSVRGRTERSYDSRNTEDSVNGDHASESSEHGSTYHKATVEDESSRSDAATTTETNSNQVATKSTQGEVTTQSHRPSHKYWVSERSIGEFQRTFNFPTRIDQDHVKASLKDGILSITVPKAQAPVTRRINIE